MVPPQVIPVRHCSARQAGSHADPSLFSAGSGKQRGKSRKRNRAKFGSVCKKIARARLQEGVMAEISAVTSSGRRGDSLRKAHYELGSASVWMVCDG